MYVTFNKIGKYGRLGNQMFQYATLIGVSDRLNLVPAINYSCKSDNSFLNLELDEIFNITARHSEGIVPTHVYYEKDFSYNPDVFNISPDTDLFGYFQSEKYFNHCQPKIRKEFTFKNEPKLNKKFEQFKHQTTVSLHVRRTDYLKLPDVYPFSLQYYLDALEYIETKIGKFTCLVFSDDIQWCKDNLKHKNITFVYQEGDKEEDLYFMSQTTHSIIANSSFSWWGAWLKPSPNKIIVAPKNWFGANGPKNWQDIYCDGWIIL